MFLNLFKTSQKLTSKVGKHEAYKCWHSDATNPYVVSFKILCMSANLSAEKWVHVDLDLKQRVNLPVTHCQG